MGEGCSRTIKDSWWNFCGETDMGQTAPVLCIECGGEYKLDHEVELKTKIQKLEKQNKIMEEVIKRLNTHGYNTITVFAITQDALKQCKEVE